MVDNPVAFLRTSSDTDDTFGTDDVLGKLNCERAYGTKVRQLKGSVLTQLHR